MAKTKFFRVAVEGVTSDGREITREALQQMAANYNPQKYGARVFAEHIRGAVPDGPFRALGDVLALKTETIADGPLKGKVALLAQIAPSDVMVKLVNGGQKIYSSMEIDPAFADTKQAYLVGLGITDSPASLGTEVLKFAAQNPDASPFKARKQRPENIFSEGTESDIELEAEAQADPAAGFFAKLEGLLEKFGGKAKPEPKPEPAAAPAEGESTLRAEFASTLQEFSSATQAALAGLRADVKAQGDQVKEQLAQFKQVLDTTPEGSKQRPAATGGNGTVATDC